MTRCSDLTSMAPEDVQCATVGFRRRERFEWHLDLPRLDSERGRQDVELNPVAPLAKDPSATGSPNYFVSNYIISNDPGGAATAYNTLPLDYYASGSGYGVAKTAWDATSTQLTYFFKTPMSNVIGHSHEDWGSFSLWRGGRWIMRETAGYSDTIAGTPAIAGGAGQDTASPFAHNVPVFTNVALGMDLNASYLLPTVDHRRVV